MTASYMFEPDHANAFNPRMLKKGYVALKMLQVSFTASQHHQSSGLLIAEPLEEPVDALVDTLHRLHLANHRNMPRYVRVRQPFFVTIDSKIQYL